MSSEWCSPTAPPRRQKDPKEGEWPGSHQPTTWIFPMLCYPVGSQLPGGMQLPTTKKSLWEEAVGFLLHTGQTDLSKEGYSESD